MSLELFLHSQSQFLFKQLDSNLKKKWKSPFESPYIITPNPNISQWLKLKLTESRGILGNFSFLTLEAFLWKTLSQNLTQQYPNLFYNKSIQKLTPSILTMFIYEIFSKYPQDFKQIRSYFRNRSDSSQIIKATQIQLFHKLSSLFLEYQQHSTNTEQQSGFEQFWLKSKLFFSTKSQEHDKILEKEQSHLYLLIFSKKGYLEQYQKKSKICIETLPRLLDKVESLKLNIQIASIHLFNFLKLNLFQRKTLLKLSQSNSVYIYNTTPCADLWENIPNDNILYLWANSGKENFNLWQDATQWAFSPEKINLQASPISFSLKSLQHSILFPFEKTTDKSILIESDSSLQFWKTTSITNELIQTHQHIRTLLKQNPKLHLNEIAIIILKTQDYKHTIQSVFSSFKTNDPNFIPFHIIDQNSISNKTMKAFKTIVNVFSSGLNRKTFFDLISNPLIMEKHHLNATHIQQWSSFCNQFNLYNNQKDSPYGFEKILDRYLLQDFSNLEETNFHSVYSSIYSILILWKIVSNDINWFNQLGNSSWSEPCQRLLKIFDFWVSVPPQEYLTSEQALSILSDIEIRNTINSDSKVILSEFWILVSHFLKTFNFESVQLLTGGVIISPLKHVDSIPFKHTFILGLDSLSFPSQDLTSSIDLKNNLPRKLGDVPLIMEEKYYLIKTILDTQSSLTLSYNSHNLKKDIRLNPSTIIVELQEHLKRYCKIKLSSKTIHCIDDSVPDKIHQTQFLKKKTSIITPLIDIKEFSTYLKNPLLYTLNKKLSISSEITSDEDNSENKGYQSSSLDLFSLKRDYWNQFKINYGSQKSNDPHSSTLFENLYQEFIHQGKHPLPPFNQEEKKALYQEISSITEEFLIDLDSFNDWIPSITLGKQSLLSKNKILHSILTKKTKRKIQGELQSIFVKNSSTEEWIYPIFTNSKKIYLEALYPFLFYRVASLNNDIPNHFKILVYTFKEIENKVFKKKFCISKNKPEETLKFFENFEKRLENPISMHLPFQKLFNNNKKKDLSNILQDIQKENTEESSYLNSAQIISKSKYTEELLSLHYQDFKDFLEPIFSQ